MQKALRGGDIILPPRRSPAINPLHTINAAITLLRRGTVGIQFAESARLQQLTAQERPSRLLSQVGISIFCFPSTRRPRCLVYDLNIYQD